MTARAPTTRATRSRPCSSISRKDGTVKEVNVLAHSMGNWLALEALRQMAIRNGGLPAKFKNVMLAAPDVDVDVFRSQIEDMGEPHPQFTLFVSRDDKALAFSRRVWGNIPRLGSIDPETAPYKTELADYKVSVIDLTKIKVSDDLNHSKFAESPQVVQLIGQRLSEGQTLDRQPGRPWRHDPCRDDECGGGGRKRRGPRTDRPRRRARRRYSQQLRQSCRRSDRTRRRHAENRGQELRCDAGRPGMPEATIAGGARLNVRAVRHGRPQPAARPIGDPP